MRLWFVTHQLSRLCIYQSRVWCHGFYICVVKCPIQVLYMYF